MHWKTPKIFAQVEDIHVLWVDDAGQLVGKVLRLGVDQFLLLMPSLVC